MDYAKENHSLVIPSCMEGEAIGENKKAIAIARNLISMGMPAELVSQATGLSMKEIEEL